LTFEKLDSKKLDGGQQKDATHPTRNGKLDSKKLDGGQQKDATHPTRNGTFIKCYQQNG